MNSDEDEIGDEGEDDEDVGGDEGKDDDGEDDEDDDFRCEPAPT